MPINKSSGARNEQGFKKYQSPNKIGQSKPQIAPIFPQMINLQV